MNNISIIIRILFVVTLFQQIAPSHRTGRMGSDLREELRNTQSFSLLFINRHFLDHYHHLRESIQ
jgi:hypothetical protein